LAPVLLEGWFRIILPEESLIPIAFAT